MGTRIHNRDAFAAIAVLLAILGTASKVEAVRFPLSPAELAAEADFVVVAEVSNIEIRSERSRVETGFGNDDWGVYLRLKVREVEKGDSAAAGEDIVARCFVVKSRRSQMEYIGLQSHYPIPEVGQLVRAYIRRRGETYAVVHPNGLAPVDNGRLIPSAAVRNLRSRAYTYLLPLEAWISLTILITMGVSGICLIVNARRFLARRRAARAAGTPMIPRYSLASLLVVASFTALGLAGRTPWFTVGLGVLAFLTLVGFTVRTPRTSLARQLWWGVNIAFVSSLVALFSR